VYFIIVIDTVIYRICRAYAKKQTGYYIMTASICIHIDDVIDLVMTTPLEQH